jgi:hypothetical protein
LMPSAFALAYKSAFKVRLTVLFFAFWSNIGFRILACLSVVNTGL